MKAKVIEIQVGGGTIHQSLLAACLEYPSGERTKVNFLVELPSGELKSITIRDEEKETVAYGDFEGLPSFLDYTKDEKKEEDE